MRPHRRCFCCCPPRASVSSASSVVRLLRRPAPGGQHRGQRRVGFRPALVNVRDDGLRRNDPGRLARQAPVLGLELRQGGRPDRPDSRRLDPRQRPGPDRAVRKAPEGVQVEPDHFRVAGVEAPEDEAPGFPLQPVERGPEPRLLGWAPLPMQVFHARPPSVFPAARSRRLALAPTSVPPYTARKRTNSGPERAGTSVSHVVSRG